MSSISERVAKRVAATFSVGDKVEAYVDHAEGVEGVIVSIDGNHAKIENKFGTFTCWLPTAKKIEG